MSFIITKNILSPILFSITTYAIYKIVINNYPPQLKRQRAFNYGQL